MRSRTQTRATLAHPTEREHLSPCVSFLRLKKMFPRRRSHLTAHPEVPVPETILGRGSGSSLSESLSRPGQQSLLEAHIREGLSSAAHWVMPFTSHMRWDSANLLSTQLTFPTQESSTTPINLAFSSICVCHCYFSGWVVPPR